MSYTDAEFESAFAKTVKTLDTVNGWLSAREIKFLMLLAANPTCVGEILELGSFEGKSTIALARGAVLGDGGVVHSIDLIDPKPMLANLDRVGVAEHVKNYHDPSTAITPHWNRTLRFLWHDGANDIPTVTDDVQRLIPHLGDGAIIAFHDILNRSGNRIFVYCDEILQNPHFGAAGICGSIGWAQYHADAAVAQSHQEAKQKLMTQLVRLRSFHNRELNSIAKIQYKLYRSLVPHKLFDANDWKHKVGAQSALK